MSNDSIGKLDALFIFPPIRAERMADLIHEDIVSDLGKLFEYPQGILSIASYLSTSANNKRSFSARVLYLDAYLLHIEKSGDAVEAKFTNTDVEMAYCEIAEQAVRKYHPRLVGISAMYYASERSALKIAKHLKQCFGDEIIIALGGQEVSLQDPAREKPVLLRAPYVDLIVRKEGEFTTQELLEKITDHEDYHKVPGISYRVGDTVVNNEDRPRGRLVRLPPLENRLLLLPEKMSLAEYLSLTNISLVFLRGCSHSACAFCTSARWFGGIQGIDTSNAEELNQYLANCEVTIRRLLEAGVQQFEILDEEINASQPFFLGLCAILANLQQQYRFTVLVQSRVDGVNEKDFSRLKEAGVTDVYLGVESGSIDILHQMNKRINTPLLNTDIVHDVRQRFTETKFDSLSPELQQIVCACYVVKKVGLNLGLYLIVGHPGSTPAREDESYHFIENLYASGIVDENDLFEVSVYIPLCGSKAAGYAVTRIVEKDKSKWGRISGHAVCELIDSQTGEVVMSVEDVRQAFLNMHSLIEEHRSRRSSIPRNDLS